MERLLIPAILIILSVSVTSCRSCPQADGSSVTLASDTVREIRTVYVTRNLSDSVSSAVSIRDSVAPRLDSLGRVVGFDSWHFRDRTLFSRQSRNEESLTADTVWRDRVRTRTVTKTVNRPAKTPVWVAVLACFGVAFVVTTGMDIVKTFRNT